MRLMGFTQAAGSWSEPAWALVDEAFVRSFTLASPRFRMTCFERDDAIARRVQSEPGNGGMLIVCGNFSHTVLSTSIGSPFSW
jgi:hypothetical protein